MDQSVDRSFPAEASSFLPPGRGLLPGGARHLDPTLIARARPVSSSRAQLLPVPGPLRDLFPGGGLQRGTVVTVGVGPLFGERAGRIRAGGVTTLAFSLLASASVAGSWCGAVGTADPGIVALAELGIDLERVVLVPRPAGAWAEVTAALLRGMDAVLVRPPTRVRPGVARRLTARSREGRAVLVVICDHGGWPESPDLHLSVGAGAWEGIDAGHGHLQGRRVEVTVTGRRGADRPVRRVLWLPAPTGELSTT